MFVCEKVGEHCDIEGDERNQDHVAKENSAFLVNTPWKINMEPTNHPFRKENDLPNLHDYVIIFRYLKPFGGEISIQSTSEAFTRCLTTKRHGSATSWSRSPRTETQLGSVLVGVGGGSDFRQCLGGMCTVAKKSGNLY